MQDDPLSSDPFESSVYLLPDGPSHETGSSPYLALSPALGLADDADDDPMFSTEFSPERLTARHVSRYGAGGGSEQHIESSMTLLRISYDVPAEEEAWTAAAAWMAARENVEAPTTACRSDAGVVRGRHDGAKQISAARARWVQPGVTARRRLEQLFGHLGWSGG
ncbi:hypothetical protein JCM8202_002521 [Rhodotorula sphaerocarpa]